MSEVLKGNFSTRNQVKADVEENDLTQQFEKEALQRLGGSIAFVSKKKFIFGAQDENSTD